MTRTDRSGPGRTPARALWLALGPAALVFAGASSPWVAQQTPGFLFPALGATGAGLVALSFARAVARSLRGYGGGGSLGLVALGVNALAALLLVVFPATRLATLVTAPPEGTPRILTRFGARLGAEGYPAVWRHRGMDVAGRIGADVLAAADGRVTVARDTGGTCGLIVVIVHDPHGYRTVYCHLSALAVTAGETPRRGQRVGAVGTTGQRAWPGYEHVHWELQRGSDLRAVEDPAPWVVGCFDATRTYPTDRLALTYPVRC